MQTNLVSLVPTYRKCPSCQSFYLDRSSIQEYFNSPDVSNDGKIRKLTGVCSWKCWTIMINGAPSPPYIYREKGKLIHSYYDPLMTRIIERRLQADKPRSLLPSY